MTRPAPGRSFGGMRVHLQYGREGLEVEIPGTNVTVLRPAFVDGLPDEAEAFSEAVRRPIGARPSASRGRDDRVAVVIPDITRPLPSTGCCPGCLPSAARPGRDVHDRQRHRLAPDQHRPGAAVDGRARGAARYRVVNIMRTTPPRCARAATSEGGTVLMNREYVQADRRIVLGFIEPHFMAGFSGGYKAIFPAMADIESIMHYHRAGDRPPACTWGMLDGNPTQAQIRAIGSLLPVDFCINVTLNRRREITRFFCGDLWAHGEGCAFARAAMVPCAGRSHRGDHQQRRPAGPEPLPVGQGHVGGRADRRARRLYRDRRALQRHLPITATSAG